MRPLEEQLDEAQRLLDAYLDLAADQEDDDSLVARGNGFCNRKYSDDFLQMQIAQLTARVAHLKSQSKTLQP